jgi:hypothetical protein
MNGGSAPFALSLALTETTCPGEFPELWFFQSGHFRENGQRGFSGMGKNTGEKGEMKGADFPRLSAFVRFRD